MIARAALCLVVCGALACGDDVASSSGSSAEASGDASSSASTASGGTCNRLFGRPTATTGLDETLCAPECDACGDGWQERPWTAERIEALRGYELAEPIAELASDPYAVAPSPAPEGSVCGVVVEDVSTKRYRLATYASESEAAMAGAITTHGGGCGVCSSLADLAVYASELDLTTPVRACGIQASGDFDANVTCLEELGFSRPCAQIWAYNTAHTRDNCLSICTELLGAPYHEPDGSLNACLQCDEDVSGPVFKAVAGRTRRNTGIASALCRPCDEVLRLEHDYP
jgi:hypothetical protein